jgi:hypothetical protein
LLSPVSPKTAPPALDPRRFSPEGNSLRLQESYICFNTALIAAKADRPSSDAAQVERPAGNVVLARRRGAALTGETVHLVIACIATMISIGP